MMHFDFNLGGHIQCKEGECGKLAGLVVEPEARQVTHFIIERGFLGSQAHVLPIALVQSALDDEIYLSISSYEFDQYPRYRVTEYERPATGVGQPGGETATSYGLYGTSAPTVPTVKEKIREGILHNQQVIERDMSVNNIDGKIGKVVRVVVDRENQEITHVVVQRGLIFHEQLVIPVSMVESIYEDGIVVTGTDEALEKLPRYEAEKLAL
jgi:uncharacterized protein YrrD